MIKRVMALYNDKLAWKEGETMQFAINMPKSKVVFQINMVRYNSKQKQNNLDLVVKRNNALKNMENQIEQNSVNYFLVN